MFFASLGGGNGLACPRYRRLGLVQRLRVPLGAGRKSRPRRRVPVGRTTVSMMELHSLASWL